MTLRLKIGTVTSKADINQTGKFKVAFKAAKDNEPLEETVSYVSPYGSNQSAFIAIPEKGSQALCLYDDTAGSDDLQGYYYIGSLIGVSPGANRLMSVESDTPPPVHTGYIDKTVPGAAGPPTPEGIFPEVLPENQTPFPDIFQGMYDAKGTVPEMMGLTSLRSDSMTISNRYRGNKGADPYQDYKVSLQSGSGKRLALIDSPTVDGIVMTNEHRGKDYMIWSTGMSEQSPFAEGEVHWRTHGPFNLYSLFNRFHIWIEDGLNIEIENKSTGAKSYGPGGKLGPPSTGGAKATQRISTFGDETTGCIHLLSHHNNITLEALEADSVIRIVSPGADSKIIVDSGGTVDIIAKSKVTLQSDTEVEINAPIVDINATGNITVDGAQVHLNGEGPGYTA
jgi:hypothetical protein|tara:strand:- start:10258 stop:11442 length:1185 start_codon:yes stop_codon:yes gene_type:complete